MLQQMRDWFRYLKWLLVIIIFMFIWWAFATWGGGATRGRREVTWAARVNGVDISIEAYQSAARNLDSMYQSMLGDQYAQQRGLMRIGSQAIDSLVEEELMYQEAARQGITVSTMEIRDSILHDPNFQEGGKFIGLERYRNLFRGNRVTIEDYEGRVRRRLTIDKLRRLIEDAVTVGDTEVQQEFLRRNEKTSVEYIVVDATKMRSQAPPTDGELQKFYDEHKDRYARGEGRTGIFVLFSPQDAAGGVSVTDDDVAAAYEKYKPTRYAVGEQRCASHILFKIPEGAAADVVARTEKKARGVLARARKGEDFGALARKNSEDSTASSGGDLGCFPRGQMVKEFDDAAFSLPVGGVSDLVRSPFGFHIIKVRETRPAKTTPVEEVRETLRQELKLERARGDVLRRAADFARTAAGGHLEAVAKSQGLSVQQTGEVRDGDALPGVSASQPVVSRMLGMSPGDVSDPLAIPAGQVVVQIVGTAPPATRSFQESRAQVLKDLDGERARKAVGDAVQAAGRAGGLKAVARALKVDLKTQADLTDGATLQGLPADPALEKQIGTLAPGSVGDPISTAAGIVVLGVTSRANHLDELPTQKDSIADGLLKQKQDRLYRALVKKLKQSGDVQVNRQIVDSLDRA